MSIYSGVKFKIIHLFRRATFSPIKYWEARARKYGELSVLNLSHSEEELKLVKEAQIATIFPLLKKELKGNEKTLLDFGCGPGRFSAELGDLTGCRVTGADPIEYLLQLAPKSPNVTYKKIEKSTIPTEKESFDIIWICLVLGGIVNKKDLDQTVREINRVAKKDGLLFLIENTADKKNILSWKYRSIPYYIDLFKNLRLVHLKDYYDGDERISIFAGRNTTG